MDESRKINCPYWRGVYECSNIGCCKFEFEVQNFNEISQKMVDFSCVIRGKANHCEKINKEILKRIDAKEKFQLALKIMANSNNTETVTNMQIDELKKNSTTQKDISNSEKLKKQATSFENLQNLNLKNRLKDRYRKILANLFGKL
jgi:hypothetical protein